VGALLLKSQGLVNSWLRDSQCFFPFLLAASPLLKEYSNRWSFELGPLIYRGDPSEKSTRPPLFSIISNAGTNSRLADARFPAIGERLASKVDFLRYHLFSPPSLFIANTCWKGWSRYLARSVPWTPSSPLI